VGDGEGLEVSRTGGVLVFVSPADTSSNPGGATVTEGFIGVPAGVIAAVAERVCVGAADGKTGGGMERHPKSITHSRRTTPHPQNSNPLQALTLIIVLPGIRALFK
jgi:hypothetical protein